MHQIMPISAMENVERAFASEVRLNINQHSSRKCYLNSLDALQTEKGPLKKKTLNFLHQVEDQASGLRVSVGISAVLGLQIPIKPVKNSETPISLN